MTLETKKTILVAPLNWGLGHAARCIPIINGLLENGFAVLIASDGAALELLKLEFPEVPYLTFPSYNISYPKNGNRFKKNMLQLLPRIYKAALEEKKTVAKLVKEKRIQGIISDNRLGIRNRNVTSVYLTHQLSVLSGSTTWLSSKMHHYFIDKFDACWVPDFIDKSSLAGKLSTKVKSKKPITYIGPLSRMKYRKANKENDILIILSGPEPQRGLLEKLLIEKFINSKKNILMVCGVVEKEQHFSRAGTLKLVNYLTTLDLERAINCSDIVICRSGYTSIMDLYKLNKKTFFIPTPGQFEQEYLAQNLHKQKRIPSSSQGDFEVSKLEDIVHFNGWKTKNAHTQDFASLFSLF